MHILKNFFEILFGIAMIINAAVYIPQALKLIRMKHTKEVSLITFSSFTIFLFVQCVYALLRHDTHFLWGSLLVLMSSFSVTSLIIYFRVKSGDIQPDLLKKLVLAILIIVILFGSCHYLHMVDEYVMYDIVTIVYGAAFLWIWVSAAFQILTLLRIKDSNQLSIATFLGFNFIQTVTLVHAYFYQEWLLFAGICLLLLVYAWLSYLVIYYRLNNKY
jgi:uncharacterized protein with PQ loop repeat